MIRKPKGYIIETDIYGCVNEADTNQCCHCGNHFRIIKGSGKKRGFCLKCMQTTCGKLKCDICYPFEKKLEEYEKGKRKILD